MHRSFLNVCLFFKSYNTFVPDIVNNLNGSSEIKSCFELRSMNRGAMVFLNVCFDRGRILKLTIRLQIVPRVVNNSFEYLNGFRRWGRCFECSNWRSRTT